MVNTLPLSSTTISAPAEVGASKASLTLPVYSFLLLSKRMGCFFSVIAAALSVDRFILSRQTCFVPVDPVYSISKSIVEVLKLALTIWL